MTAFAHDSPRTADRHADPTLQERLSRLASDLHGLFSDRVELLSLEVHRAAIALAQILALAFLFAIVGVTVWLMVSGAVVVGLCELGVPLGWALLAVGGANALAAWWTTTAIRRLLPRVSLPATRRHLVPQGRAQ